MCLLWRHSERERHLSLGRIGYVMRPHEDIQRDLKALTHRVEVLERQVKSMRRRSIEAAEYIDTVTSPLWKRIIWWCEGFYFRKVGRWYAPNWIPRWPK